MRSVAPADLSGDTRLAPNSIGPAVLVRENPFIRKHGADVVMGVGGFVARRAVSDLEVDDIRRGAIDEVMRDAAGGKGRASTQLHPDL